LFLHCVVDEHSNISEQLAVSIVRVADWLISMLKWLGKNKCVSYTGKLEEIQPTTAMEGEGA
jgi:hypothetical protein